jgi:hypothetical protein
VADAGDRLALPSRRTKDRQIDSGWQEIAASVA